MSGTIENAIYADKLDAEGNLWAPDEQDPTLDRCTLLSTTPLKCTIRLGILNFGS